MILIEFLLAPTVPSAPRPKNTARTRSSASMSKSASTGIEVCVTSSTMPTVKWFFGPSRRTSSSKTAFTMRGREFLRREAVAAADHERVDRERRQAGLARLAERADHVEVERLADRARLLGAVEHRDRAHRGGQRRDEVLDRERPEQPHLQHADLLAVGDEVLDGLVRDLGARAHHHDHALGLRVADVVEQLVVRGRCARRSGPSPSRRYRGRRGRSRCRPRAPGRRRRGSAPCRAAPAGRASARAGGARPPARR